ncbi:MAG TPA: hypothetical protein PKV97_00120 [Thauera aminoaromatica]|nr:hypothetical protein [Thauera aminoaromatica]
MSRKANKRNIQTVLGRISTQCKEDPTLAAFWVETINNACDSAGDAFGTEGQNDPRGDQRD